MPASTADLILIDVKEQQATIVRQVPRMAILPDIPLVVYRQGEEFIARGHPDLQKTAQPFLIQKPTQLLIIPNTAQLVIIQNTAQLFIIQNTAQPFRIQNTAHLFIIKIQHTSS